jgi:hypothetical protein
VRVEFRESSNRGKRAPANGSLPLFSKEQISYAVTKSRPFDRRYDPFYRDSTMHARPTIGYRVALQGTYVNASDRPLFFATPMAVSLHATCPEVVLERQAPPPAGSPRDVDALDAHEKFDVAVQTLYRESEGQTNPWLPDTTENTKPRAWFEEEELEKLPLEQRQKRLVEMEVEQWAKRERAIIELQQRRLSLLVQKFQAREDEAAVTRQRRVEAVLTDREKRRLEAVERIEKRRLKVLRTLTEQRRQMTTKKHTKRDIITDYSDNGAAPMRRFGARAGRMRCATCTARSTGSATSSPTRRWRPGTRSKRSTRRARFRRSSPRRLSAAPIGFTRKC